MGKIKFFDTNAILENYDKFFENSERFVVSSQSLIELENIKTSAHKDSDIKYKARRACRVLDENLGKYDVSIDSEVDLNLPQTPDNIIMTCAYRWNKDVEPIVFVTNDIACKIIANNIYGLDVECVCEDDTDSYTGYKEICGNAEFINEYMSNIDYSQWTINQYLIIKNTDDGKYSEMRYDGERFMPLKLPPSNYVKAKNHLQRCALDLLLNKDITIVAILGGYGSGKSFLATQMALYNVLEKGLQSKILGIREPKGEGMSIGFLKGSWEDKTGKFFKPIEQQLKGGEFELNSLISRGVLETNIPYYLKGTTYDDTIMLVDEAEDLTESQIRLIGTRVGENGKVYFSGDYEQSLHDKTKNNGLVKMCNALKGNPKFGCIYLDEDVRSDTSKLFANLFK